MTVTTRTRTLLRERAHGCCEMCGKSGANNAHHRINQSQGGPDTLSNLLLLCGSGTTGCHGWVTTHPEDARRQGLSVARSQVPFNKQDQNCAANIPVRRWSRELGGPEWVLLDDDGGLTPELEPIV